MSLPFSHFLAGDYPDPSILRLDQDFYMTHSPLAWSPGALIWHSRDLVHWKPIVRALEGLQEDVWSPELAFCNGKFFIYYFSHTHSTINAVVADHILGPWSEPLDLKVSSSRRRLFDPGHLVGQDGSRYLYLADGLEGNHLVLAKLSADGLSVEELIEDCYRGWPFPLEWRTEGVCLEAPKVFFHDGWYHLISGQGGTAGPSTSHMAIHARSRSPKGPWENSPYNPIIKTWRRQERWWSTGHATVFDAGKNEWWAVFHGYLKHNLPLGRHTLLQPMEWTPDGWLVLKNSPSAPAESKESIAISAEHHPLDFSDSFSGPELGIQWSFFGGAGRGRFAFEEGALAMRGFGTSPSDCSPMAFAAPESAYQIEVDVESTGSATGGLTLFYNPSAHVSIGMGMEAVWWSQRGHMNRSSAAQGPLQARLRIVCDNYEVYFQIRLPGQSWENIPGVPALEVSGYQHNSLGGFMSLRPGVFACGDGTVKFRNFVYQSLADSKPEEGEHRPRRRQLAIIA